MAQVALNVFLWHCHMVLSRLPIHSSMAFSSKMYTYDLPMIYILPVVFSGGPINLYKNIHTL